MAVAATTRPRALALAPVAAPAAFALLTAASVLLRTTRLDVGFWIDEGLSVGIADRPLTDIPGTLRLDGSPPLYYVLLHVWMALTGSRSEQTTHALSLIFATVAIPVTFALVRSLTDDRTAWIAAALVALNPFLTAYAQETRMYALVVLLGLIASLTFAGAFVLGRGRRWLVAFALAFAALMYTHNWALFAGVGFAAAWAWLVWQSSDRPALVRDGLLAAAIVLVLYAPWIPTTLFQSAHTGAPWAKPPTLANLVNVPKLLLGQVPQMLLLLGGGAGVLMLWRRKDRIAAVFAIVALATFAVAWLASQASPAWATRYLAAGLPPLLVLLAVALAQARGLGVATLLLVSAFWLTTDAPAAKSNVREVAASVAPSLAPGDLVISTQPEQAPVLHYYLRDVPGLRWATITGPLTDLGVTDWRDGERRLRSTSVERDLAPLLASVRPGQHVVVVVPIITSTERWSAPWTALVRKRSTAWVEAMRNDPRYRVVNVEPDLEVSSGPNPVRAFSFVRE